MFWLGSGGSPLTVYRTTSLRIQGQRQVTAGVSTADRKTVRTVSNEKKNDFGVGLCGGDQP
jgi:hypothetical protein